MFQTNAPDGCINFIYRTLQMTQRLTAVSRLEKGHHFLEGIQNVRYLSSLHSLPMTRCQVSTSPLPHATQKIEVQICWIYVIYTMHHFCFTNYALKDRFRPMH